MKRIPFLILILPLFISSCYYDKADQLYLAQTCNLDSITYTKTIQPIISSKCSITGCHDAATLACGYDLSQYDAMKDIADEGTLLGSINHASAFSSMPKDAAKLPACAINQITLWVNAGAPNN